MKKCFIIIGMVVFTFCLGFYVSAQFFDNNRTKGDVNVDGVVNILDALRTVNIILGVEPPPTPDELWAADCNGDGLINVIEVLGIINTILNIGTCISCEELDCDDGNPCTDDYCDSLLIQCVHDTLSGISCDDGNPCTVNDICQNGNCVGTPKECIDIDGNTYQTVMIGDQCWMAENLKATHYRNGDPIRNVADDTEWINLTTGGYCDYDNDSGNSDTYGRLYNWYAVNDSRYIAPEGWHVPSDAEWKQLEMYLGMNQSDADTTGFRGTDEGGKMKTTGTIEGEDGFWFSPNIGATNESGFSALPGGYRYGRNFEFLGCQARFWSSTEYDSIYAWYRFLSCYGDQVYRSFSYGTIGYSVRCLRD